MRCLWWENLRPRTRSKFKDVVSVGRPLLTRQALVQEDECYVAARQCFTVSMELRRKQLEDGADSG